MSDEPAGRDELASAAAELEDVVLAGPEDAVVPDPQVDQDLEVDEDSEVDQDLAVDEDSEVDEDPAVDQGPAVDQDPAVAQPVVDAEAHAEPTEAGPLEADPLERPGPSAPAPTTPNGWLVLARALRPRATKAQALAGVLCAVLGFALVVQVRQNNGTNLGGMRQADLVRMLDETTDRGDALARQESDLQAEHDQLLSGSDRRQAALDALRRTATTQGILTGRLPAQGPGVVVTLSEPSGQIRPLTMLDVLEELRNAGAEAVELNGHRVTASSAFTGEPGAVVLDGDTLTSPFRWTVIGDPDTIATALQIPGGALAAVRNDGGAGTIERADVVQVSSIRVVPDPVYATPVPVASP